MFKYSFSDYLWLYGVAIVFWAIVFLILRLFNKNIGIIVICYCLLLSIAFSFLGLTIGILIGLSESPVIGLIIPALLTFFGGFIIYAFVFASKKKIEDGYVLLLILLSVSFFLMLGSDYGGSARCDYDAKESEYEYAQKKDFELFKHNLSIEPQRSDMPTQTTDTATKSLFEGIMKNNSPKK